ncbi:MAG: LacI family transcriptional regulator [Treponema sp.]|jgi:LacI family transcriptional regulator|nr:LacI family transcriptional regulator [Treponema sp.]
MVNIKDIARRVGMSPSTVSRVINGKNHVNAFKRERILSVIEETGYVPNNAARSMVLKRSFTVGIVIPDAFNMFQRQLFSIIERYLDSFGYHTVFFFAKFDGSGEKELLARIQSERPDGIIMLHEIREGDFYSCLAGVKLPVVTATFYRDAVPSIHVNETEAAFDGVTHLINLGHRRISVISGSECSFGRQRVEGFFRALEQAGIPRDESQVILVGNYTAEFGMYGMRELLLRNGDFTAVFAVTDELAIGAIRALEDAGLDVPGDISVVGFDDIDISGFLMPRLTTIRQPLGELGEKTALALHRAVNGGGAAKDIVLPHKLIIRESTRALPRRRR